MDDRDFELYSLGWYSGYEMALERARFDSDENNSLTIKQAMQDAMNDFEAAKEIFKKIRDKHENHTES